MSGKASAEVTIEATVRTQGGKGYSRKLRKAGKLPAVLNHQGKSTLIEFDPKLLSKAWQSPEHKFKLTLNGTTRAVKVTDLQVHAVKRTAIHCDLTYAD